jgi:carbamoylphosphate synthase large subunit
MNVLAKSKVSQQCVMEKLDTNNKNTKHSKKIHSERKVRLPNSCKATLHFSVEAERGRKISSTSLPLIVRPFFAPSSLGERIK